MNRAISRSLLAVGLTSVLALSACGGGESACAAGAVVMPAPPPKPAPRPAPAPAYKAPAPAPKPPAPKPPTAVKPPAPRPVAPRPSVYRPLPPRYDRSSPSYDYRAVYNRPSTDYTPLLFLLALNGSFSPSQPTHQECESR